MKTKYFGYILIGSAILITSLACNLPFMSTPTPFVFPTPDMTMTALFVPTVSVVEPTSTPMQIIIETQMPTATSLPPTEEPTVTPKPSKTPIPPTPVPPSHRSGPRTEAQYVKKQPAMDGGWGDWVADEYSADAVVFGDNHWNDEEDLSSSYKVQWDEDYLYIAWKVTDSKYVQLSKKANLYLGDSVEVLIDTAVQYDYWQRWLDWDDYQIGVSPGNNEVGENPEVYLWYPSAKEGTLTKAIVGVKETSTGYRVTLGIPWKTLGIEPYVGLRLGFAASVSDDDSSKGKDQQSMVSSTSKRILTDPTTWGDLILVK